MKTKPTLVDKVSTYILSLAILVMGLFVLALCIFALPAFWRGVSAENVDIQYALYGIIIALYATSAPFYYALVQALKLLVYIDKQVAFSKKSVHALRKISYSGFVISGMFAASLPFFYTWANFEDAPGLILVCMALVGASFTVALFAGLMQRVLRQAIEFKKENELTV